MVKVGKDLNVSDVSIKRNCINRGIPTPEAGFWNKVKAGIVEDPQGYMPPEQAKQFAKRDQAEEAYTHDDYIIQRGRCNGKTGAGARLATWFRGHGWDRKQVTHEMRKLHLSRYLLATGDLVATSKQAGHTTTKMTEQVYIDVLKKHKANIELPNA